MWTKRATASTEAFRARRARVLIRDHAICHLCGGPGATHLDHIVPLREGGVDAEDNCAPAHAHCAARRIAAEARRAGRGRNDTGPATAPGTSAVPAGT